MRRTKMDNNQMQGGGPGRPQGPGGQKQPDNGRNKNNGKKQGGGKSILVFLVITLIVMLATNIVTSMVKDTTEREITYNQFINMVDRGEVESVEIGSNRIDINLKNQPIPGVKITCYTGIMDDPTLTDRLLKAGVQCTKTVPDNSSYLILNIVANVLPLVMIGFIFYFFMRRMGSGGGVMGVGKSKAKVYGEKETGVTFQDVAGQDEAKESLQEVVGFLEDPQKYVKIGAKLPKGARHCWQRQSQERHTCRSSPFPVPISWKCLSVSVHRVCETCLKRPKRVHRVSFLSMRSMRSVRAVTAVMAAETTSVSRH